MKKRFLLAGVLIIALVCLCMTGCQKSTEDYTNTSAKMRPIVVLGPMECEYTTLAESLDGSRTIDNGGYQYVEGRVEGYPVVVVRSLIGMVNASAATTIAIDNYNPLCVIIQGTSGGHNPDLHQGDIVLGKNMKEIGSYYTKHRDAGQGSDFTEWDYPGEEFLKDGEVVRVTTLHSDKRLLKIAKSVPNKYGKLVLGTHGTADVWSKEIDRINFCHEEMGTDCEEMESYSVAQACKHFGVPCLAIRIISNSELHPEEEFSEDYAVYCQEYTLDVIKKIIKEYN